jgi:NAD(P)-dependent dehydrogenase (short-subunit alcohol dehydrogenase family)
MSRRIELRAARVVVTGAGSGIGAATALGFTGEGSHVIAVDINGESAARTAGRCSEEVAARAGAPAAASYVCDVADSAAVRELAAEVERDHGPVDVLVNNAGVGVGGSLLETSVEDWDWLRGINLDGVAYGCYAFGPGMVKRGHGHVVNVASGAAYIPNRSMAAYCATKSAVFSFSQCLRADWAGAGVGVSVICPGLINTPIPSHSRMYGRIAERQDALVRAFRFGHSPDVVAKAIVRAVEKNQAIVPVGLESTLAYRVLRFAPGPVQGLVAKARVR